MPEFSTLLQRGNDWLFIPVEHGHQHHAVPDSQGLGVSAPGYRDPHELAHANDIRRRFANREVTTGQIAMFGLTGGLILLVGQF